MQLEEEPGRGLPTANWAVRDPVLGRSRRASERAPSLGPSAVCLAETGGSGHPDPDPLQVRPGQSLLLIQNLDADDTATLVKIENDAWAIADSSSRM
jgi:hypothetical protein